MVLNNPNINLVTLLPGKYYLTDILKITKKGFRLEGDGTSDQIHIIQTNPDKDGISIEADNVVIRDISLHVPHSKKVALTVASSNKTTVTKCQFYGNQDFFTIYYAGPSNLTAGVSTLEAYQKRALDQKNVFRSNVVYTNFSGDSVSFSLQKNGIFSQNIIRGGKVAVYMCLNTKVTGNHIYDSSSQGLFISLPSHDLEISRNNIYHCNQSGITIKRQTEHIDPSGELDKASDYNIIIDSNTIYDNNFIGIEINDGRAFTISKNKFLHNQFRGIYQLNCQDIKIISNSFSYFSIAIELINLTGCEISLNEFYSIHPQISEKALVMLNIDDFKNLNNKISYNNFYGLYVTPIHDPDPDDTNIISDNTNDEYYSYGQEVSVIKLLK